MNIILLFNQNINRKYSIFLNRGQAGRIINIASLAGRVGVPYMSPYHASKFAVIGFSDSLRDEMQTFFNIWVCTVEPSYTRTPILENTLKNVQDYTQKKNGMILIIKMN